MKPLAPEAASSLLETARESLPADLIDKLSAPFILSALPAARKVLLVFGQETFGWGGAKPAEIEGRLRYWLDRPALSASEALADFYEELFLSDDRSTPFWDARRSLSQTLGDEWMVVWSNLMRVDTSPLSVRHELKTFSSWWNLSYPEVDAICAWQAPLHRAECSAISPNAAVFLTGPHYDYCINRSLAIVEREDVLGHSERVAARLHGLPFRAFRTYHPNYLRRRGRWDLLAQLARLIAEECS